MGIRKMLSILLCKVRSVHFDNEVMTVDVRDLDMNWLLTENVFTSASIIANELNCSSLQFKGIDTCPSIVYSNCVVCGEKYVAINDADFACGLPDCKPII